jgi:hypothetical protein
MPRNTHLSLAFAHVGRGQARIIVEVEARACPLRQVQKTHGGCGVLPYLPPQYRTTLPASEAVTDVTDYFSSSPLFFGHRVAMFNRQNVGHSHRSSKKLHSLPSLIRRIIQRRRPPSAETADLGRALITGRSQLAW